MAKYEDKGFCPCNSIIHNQEEKWQNLSEDGKGYRRAFWSMVAPFMVCKDTSVVGIVNEPSKLFFGRNELSNKVLAETIKRYDFTLEAPIWIQAMDDRKPVATFITENKNATVIYSTLEPGIVVIADGEQPGELLIAYWI